MPKSSSPARAGLGSPWSGAGIMQFPANSQDQPLGCAVTPRPFSASHSQPHLQPWLPGPSLGSGSGQDRRPVSPRLPGLGSASPGRSCTEPSPGAVGAASGGSGLPIPNSLSAFSGSTLALCHPTFNTKTAVSWEKIPILSSSLNLWGSLYLGLPALLGNQE